MPAAAEFRRLLLLCLVAPFRVAKMLDVHSLLVPAELSLILSFLLRGRRLPPLFIFRKAIFAQNPRLLPWVSCSYACACFSRRENARRSFAPRSCGTIAHSLIFAPRRRLPPPFIFRKALFAQNPRQRRGFLALMPAPALRVAKMQDVLSLPKKSIIHTELTSRPAGNINPPPSLRAFLPHSE